MRGLSTWGTGQAASLDDLLALLALGALWTVVLIVCVMRGRQGAAFGMGDPRLALEDPTGPQLRDFYGVETRPDGSQVRWSKPTAVVRVPVNAPGTYTLTFSLEVPDLGPGSAGRPLTVRAGGEPLGTVSPPATPGAIVFPVELSPQDWARDRSRSIVITLQTPSYQPANDRRALGVLVSAVAVRPDEASPPNWALIVIPNLARILLAYAALRWLGASCRAAAAVGLAGGAALALLAFFDPSDAVFLAEEAGIQPLAFASTLLTVGGGAWVARTVLRTDPGAYRKRAAWLVLALFGWLGGLALISAIVFTTFSECPDGTSPSAASFLGRLELTWIRADACHYQQIAANGYSPGSANVAFFPLYPLLLRVLSIVPGRHMVVVGGILALVLAFAALAGVERLLQLELAERTVRWAVVLMAAWPAALFLIMPFTEGLFLALAAWTLLFARQGRWWWAAAGAILIALTRAQGAIIGLPLLWLAWIGWRRGKNAPWVAGIALLPVATFGLWSAWTRRTVGMTPSAAQTVGWEADFRLPWQAIGAAFGYIRYYGNTVQALNLAALLAGIALAVFGWRKLPLAYSGFVLPQLLLMTTFSQHNRLPSTTRFLLVLFPLFATIAVLTAGRPSLRATWLVGSLWILGWLGYAYIHGPFIA